MEEKIKKLKNLLIAREIASNYDYVPEPEDVDEVHELLTEGLEISIDLYDLLEILKEHSGESPGTIVDEAFNIIEEL